MHRRIMQELVDWKDRRDRRPLVVRGARQVGKTYLVEQFAREHFQNLISVNFDVTVHGGRSRITDVHRPTLRHHDHGCVDLDEVRRLSVSDEGWRFLPEAGPPPAERRRLSVR